MKTSLSFPASTEPNLAPAGRLGAFIQTCRQDLQTGLVVVDLTGLPSHSLLFVRGELVNVYQLGEAAVRLDATAWVESMSTGSPAAVLRSLALTPQGVRIIRILIEQWGETPCQSFSGPAIVPQFAAWLEQPLPALVHVRWPGADALALVPGQGIPPSYTLFISPEKILHSAGSLAAIHAWQEIPISCALYSSDPPTLAWSEYLLHHAFSQMMGSLLENFEKLTGRMVFNQIIHDVNFSASAHGWNMTVHINGLNDQAVFASPQAAASVYSLLLQSLSGHIASVVGIEILDMLVRETVGRMPIAYRGVIKKYILNPQPNDA